jgi:hypothetical protein
MKPVYLFAAACLAVCAMPSWAQSAKAPELGEVAVTGNRMNARYAQQDRPVIGMRRQADSVVLSIAVSSDSRDEATRKREIYSMLLSALDRANGAGLELVTGNFELTPVTKANYQEIPLVWAGRPDTSKADLMVKVKLDGSIDAAQKRIDAFVKSISKSERGAVDKVSGLTLTIINPDQYRDTIVKLIAEHTRTYAGMFGPDYAVQINGIDGQVNWSQVSGTEVFLYIPYRYTIVPK